MTSQEWCIKNSGQIISMFNKQTGNNKQAIEQSLPANLELVRISERPFRVVVKESGQDEGYALSVTEKFVSLEKSY